MDIFEHVTMQGSDYKASYDQFIKIGENDDWMDYCRYCGCLGLIMGRDL